MTKKKIQILLSAAAFLFLTSGSAPSAPKERKVSRIEKRADRNFIRQKFDKAMAQYERAIQRRKDEGSLAALHLKVARLYFMVRNYPYASEHYARAMELREKMLLVDDVCNYVDALRFQGQTRKAEAICLNNAYKDIYSRYQRYQNTLQALAMQHSMEDEAGYYVNRLSLNGMNSEFWVGVFDGQPFYAMSYSRFNDPNKLFFHHTHYYELNERNGLNSPKQKTPRYYNYFRRIPADMHNGPVTFSPDMSLMIATVVKYDDMKTTVDMVDKNLRPFRTQLYYSVLKNNIHRFTKYKPVFPQEPGASYAHPFLFDNGKTLLFASDMEGGYGGFDLYMSLYDEDTRTWGTPVNLGPEVNTEGDEIFPVVYKNRLIFSSNGLPGFGGYDLFGTQFDKDGVVAGSVSHFPSPVNSVFNDYYMCPLSLHAAYFISDRDLGTKDDIYYLRTTDELGTQRGIPFYGMSEEAAIMGGQLLLSGMAETAVHQTVSLKNYVPGGLLLTLYFDFDSAELTGESVQRLQEFVNGMSGYQFKELEFEGFADEIGSERYNYGLSERRAEAVAQFLRDNGISTRSRIQGKGILKLSPAEVKEELGTDFWDDTGIDWIQVNRRARRVEIYHKR
ncbi:OmpA family protein [Bacteroides sp.]